MNDDDDDENDNDNDDDNDDDDDDDHDDDDVSFYKDEAATAAKPSVVPIPVPFFGRRWQRCGRTTSHVVGSRHTAS